MRFMRRIGLNLLLIVVWLLCGVAPLQAGQPTEAIRAAIDQGVEIVKGAKLDSKADKTSVINQLREIVYPLFDFDEMARRSLGPHWRRLKPQQQTEFVASFRELLEKTYADKIDLYEGQKVAFSGESIDRDYAQVDTRVIGKEQSYAVDYRLHLVDGKWKIYDVVAENISLVNNYRSQFNRVLSNSSYDELLRIMKEKSA
jgi:phospholipid transport system substrate-binding protein